MLSALVAPRVTRRARIFATSVAFCTIALQTSSAASAPNDDLGPSTAWPTGKDDRPYVRGPLWDDPSVVTMPPPHLAATVSEGSPATIAWSLTLRVTARDVARGTFEIGPEGAELTVDGSFEGRRVGSPLVVALEPGEHVLTLRGSATTRTIDHLTTSGTFDLLTGLPPIETRHLLMGTRSVVDHARIEVVLPVGSTDVQGPYRVSGTATVRIPDGWYGADRSDHSTFPCTPRGYTESTYRCEYEPLRFPWSNQPSTVEAAAGTTQQEVHVAVVVRSPLHRPFIIPGGPIVGLGGELGQGFRMRLGYELAIKSRYAMLSTSVDTDYTTNAVAAVTLKSAWGLGLLGAGVGIPVRAVPYVATGARLEGDIFLGPVGFVASADIWLFAPGRTHATGTLLGVISF